MKARINADYLFFLLMCVLSKKFAEWEKWYSEDDNSVCAQIREMLIDAAVFNLINEARKYASTDAKGNPELNNMVHGLINRNFFKTQTLSIRRLCEKYDENRDKRKEREVISLRRLIDDMKKNGSLLTRENILSALELPYDFNKAISEGHCNNDSRLITKGTLSENMHKNIDLLAGVGCTKRRTDDMVQGSVFKKLSMQLDKLKPVVNFVNKIVAHAATSESREGIPARDLKISLAKIHMAHCRIIKTAEFIGQRLLYKSSGQTKLPAFAYDVFEHFEKPWVKKESIAKLRDFWGKYERRIKRLAVREPGF